MLGVATVNRPSATPKSFCYGFVPGTLLRRLSPTGSAAAKLGSRSWQGGHPSPVRHAHFEEPLEAAKNNRFLCLKRPLPYLSTTPPYGRSRLSKNCFSTGHETNPDPGGNLCPL